MFQEMFVTSPFSIFKPSASCLEVDKRYTIDATCILLVV